MKNETPKHRGLRRLPSGHWLIDAQIAGRRLRVSTGTSSLSAAKTILNFKRRELAEESHLGRKPRSTITLKRLIEKYLARPGGNACDKTSYKHVMTFFGGDRFANDVTTGDVLLYRERRASERKRDGRPLSSRTINIEVSFLRAMFNFGIRAGLVPTNPVTGLPPLAEAKRLRIPTKDEVKRLLREARKGPEYLYSLIVLAVNTAARRGELLALTWRDVDWARGVLWIARGKGNRSRYVPLNEAAASALRRLPKNGDHIFPVASIKTAYGNCRKRAGLDARLSFHSLRHFAASQLAERGCDVHALRSILGHSTLGMAVVYVHTSEARMGEAVRALPDFDEEDAAEVADAQSSSRDRMAT